MTTQAAPTGAPRQSRRRWLRWLLVLLLLFFALPIGYYFCARWSLERELAEVIAETDRLDPRWRLEDIEADRKTYRDEENAALQVVRFRKLWTGGSPASDRRWVRAFDRQSPETQLYPEQIEIIREYFDKYPEALIEARKLKDPGDGRFPIVISPDWISTDRRQLDARVFFIVLSHDAILRAHQGDLDGALETCRAILGACRSYGDDACFIAVLHRIFGNASSLSWVGERCLAQGFPSNEALKQLQSEIAAERDKLRAHWMNAVRGERAARYRFFLALNEGRLRMSQFRMKASFLDRVKDNFPVLESRGFPEQLRCMNEFVEAAQLPLESQLDRFHAIGQTRKPLSLVESGFAYNFVSFENTCGNHLFAQARLACAQTGLACERFRIIQKRWPESLAELVNAKLLDAVPADPYDGQPLRLAMRKDGITVYSVGKDKEDNGGKLDPDGGSPSGTDLGFRLWDPDKRRQPSRPPVIIE